jgi:hypothetical protein
MARIARHIIALIFAFGCVTPSHAVVLLDDHFDADSVFLINLDFNNFIHWTVDNGTVDYIRQGGGLNCVGGAGGCVDSDGSQMDAGRLVSKATFELQAGTAFTISLDVSGNQRDGATDVVNVGLVDAATALTPIAVMPCIRQGGDPYSNCGLTGLALVGGTVRAFIEGVGNDNVGAVFDNFLLVTAVIPEPETYGMLLAGLGLLGFAARRRGRGLTLAA